jgi:hypothetical protein
MVGQLQFFSMLFVAENPGKGMSALAERAFARTHTKAAPTKRHALAARWAKNVFGTLIMTLTIISEEVRWFVPLVMKNVRESANRSCSRLFLTDSNLRLSTSRFRAKPHPLKDPKSS